MDGTLRACKAKWFASKSSSVSAVVADHVHRVPSHSAAGSSLEHDALIIAFLIFPNSDLWVCCSKI